MYGCGGALAGEKESKEKEKEKKKMDPEKNRQWPCELAMVAGRSKS
jgi:hypothetical protein